MPADPAYSIPGVDALTLSAVAGHISTKGRRSAVLEGWQGVIRMEPKIAVTVARRLDVPAGRVFDAWLDPATLGRWLFATKSGEVVRVEVDPRVGGSFIVVDRRNGEDVAHTGEYVEIDRPRRLVFDFRVEKYADRPSRVSVDIEPKDDGGELTLTHHFGAEMAEFKERTQAGWGMVLDALAGMLA